LDDIAFGQIEPFEESLVVKSLLDFFQQRCEEDQSMPAVKNLSAWPVDLPGPGSSSRE